MTEKIDPFQARLLKEECILVNDKDEIIGSASKRDCHLISNINTGMLHRAFSQNRLLLQQRSQAKITFPGLWTNTCCSHPLFTEIEKDGTLGVKNAACRRLRQELGIQGISPSDLNLITRIIYKAGNENGGSDKWGEHEVDYILTLQKDVDLDVNPNEIQATSYITNDQLSDFIKAHKVTPWFKIVSEAFLPNLWKSLSSVKLMEDDVIHNFVR